MPNDDIKKSDLNDILATTRLDDILHLKADLKSALEDLEFVEMVVLLHHFWHEKNLEEVARLVHEEIGETKKIELRALAKLRERLAVYMNKGE